MFTSLKNQLRSSMDVLCFSFFILLLVGTLLLTNNIGVQPVNAYNSVMPVPSSKEECKNGGWQYLYRSDGTPFKNQGDCIQYVNTGK